jgi:Holliday junction DNA helicase RuvA
MIEHLSGTVLHRSEKTIVVDVNGVGYGVEVPETLQARSVEAGDAVKMWIHTYVREDAIRLFGFHSLEEKQVFNMLISVGDVGPKLAMSILSHVDISALILAVENEDVAVIEEVPGIGPRKSKKILVELKPKLTRLLSSGQFRFAMPQESASAATRTKAGARADSGTAAAPTLDRQTVVDLKSALVNLGYKDKEIQPVLRRLELTPPSRDLGNLIKAALAELSGAGRSAEPGVTSGKNLEEIF